MVDRYKKYEPFFGSWYIKSFIGKGSYGEVYEIERRDYGVYRSALKIISIPNSEADIVAAHSEGYDDASLRSYYRSLVDEIVSEFALMSRLKGTTNIVSYEDHLVIPHENGIGWDVLIRMELLTPLMSHISAHSLTEGDIIKLGIDICHAMELCEKHKIIHRDIKPGNIFISPNGDYKLGDFGLAKIVESSTDFLSRKGTKFYIAPELYRSGGCTKRVDIYSLGMVLFFLLNDKHLPFMPVDQQTIQFDYRENAFNELMSGKELNRPVHGSEELYQIIKKAAEFEPENRYASPKEMRIALEKLLASDDTAGDRVVLTPIFPENNTSYFPPSEYSKGFPRPSEASSYGKNKKSNTGIKILFGFIFVLLLLTVLLMIVKNRFFTEDIEPDDTYIPISNEIIVDESVIDDGLKSHTDLVHSDDYDLDAELLTLNDLRNLDRDGTYLLINEIYARNGYIFSSRITQDSYESKPWYHGISDNADEIYQKMSLTEKKNIDIIVVYQIDCGYREGEKPEYLAESHRSYLKTEDLEGLSREETYMLINEIYARHGKIFTDGEIQQYFEAQEWYIPVTNSSQEIQTHFNEYERANIELIVDFQTEQGYR